MQSFGNLVMLYSIRIIIHYLSRLQGPGDMLGLVSAEYVNKFLFESKLLTFVLGHIRRLFGTDSMTLFDLWLEMDCLLYRGSCYGLSAAVGKTGAAIGTQAFTPIQLNLGKK